MDFLTKHSTANNSALKISATIIFVSLPIIGFLLGMRYQAVVELTNAPEVSYLKAVSPSQNANKTTAWKVYTNAKYGFSIDYPSDWLVREFPDSKTGASFQPGNKPIAYENEVIVADVQQKTITDPPLLTFKEYARTAATHEIQNYDELASFEEVFTSNGFAGYKTTWYVTPMGKPLTANPTKYESGPITYFEVPNTSTKLLHVSGSKDQYKEVYDNMIKSMRFAKP